MRHTPENYDDFEQDVVCPVCGVLITVQFGFCTCCPENGNRGECESCGADLRIEQDLDGPEVRAA